MGRGRAVHLSAQPCRRSAPPSCRAAKASPRTVVFAPPVPPPARWRNRGMAEHEGRTVRRITIRHPPQATACPAEPFPSHEMAAWQNAGIALAKAMLPGSSSSPTVRCKQTRSMQNVTATSHTRLNRESEAPRQPAASTQQRMKPLTRELPGEGGKVKESVAGTKMQRW